MKKSVKDFDVKDKVVILRCDLNVPIKDGVISDDTRIRASLETINYLLSNGSKVVILSHLGKVKSLEDKEKYSLSVVYDRLNELLPDKIKFVPYTSSDRIKEEINKMKNGTGILLENTRFEDLNGKRESSCDDNLSKYWASLGDIFINDAFGTLHRKHASNYGISSYLPSGVGFLVLNELNNLDKLDNPVRPFGVIMGGAKVSYKLSVINSLIDKVDYLFIGGAMAFTFLKAKGYDIGKSLCEDEQLDYCNSLLNNYGDKIILPSDFYGSNSFSDDTEISYRKIGEFDDNFMGLDIGTDTIKLFDEKLKSVKTLFWNGPLGVYEFSHYRNGTKKIMEYVSKNIDFTILGGGDIVSCVNEFGFSSKFSFISTGGGASLCYIVDKNLPGLVNIESR